jgi:dipeptidyl aminopeptidase/acylaminoacyl peptidase
MKKVLVLSLIILFISNLSFSQKNSKKPLDPSVYPNWKTLKNTIISNDGKWASYEINPLKGDGWLYIVNLDDHVKDSIPRGYQAVFSANSDFIAFKIKQPEDSVRKLKLAKKKDDELPKDSLGIFNIKTGKIVKFERVKSFKVPERNISLIAFLNEEKVEKKEPKTDTTKIKPNDTTAIKKTEPKKEAKKDKKKKQTGTEFIVLDPQSNIQHKFELVTEYNFSKNGNTLAFITFKKDSIDTTSVNVFDTKKLLNKKIFLSKGIAKKPISAEDGTRVGFVFSSDTSKNKIFNLYFWNSNLEKTELLVDTANISMPKGYSVSERADLGFSIDGSVLYFGTAPKPKPEVKDTLLDDEKAKVDVWSWTDNLLQSQQVNELEDSKKKTYSAIYRFDLNKMIQVENDTIEDVKYLKDNIDIALAYVREPHRKSISWVSPEYSDIYTINLKTGNRTLILRKQQYYTGISTFGKFVFFYNEKDTTWNTVNTETLKFNCLTKNTKAVFYNHESDVPSEPDPYGIAGWTKNDEYVLIYDKQNIWKFDPENIKKPENLTKRDIDKDIEFRYKQTDREIRYIDFSKPLLLTGFNNITKEEGFYFMDIKKKSIEQLIYANYHFQFIAKAKFADRILWSEQSFNKYPDIISSRMDFKKPFQISNTNPQQNQYLWGSVEQVKWKTPDGIELDGLLYKPENFDKNKKYPMIVYFYERNSDNLNSHWIPSPSRSIINPSIYCSNGFVVFIPDIKYELGHPGKSALKCINSGTDYILSLGFVDKDKIGIQGQSWGGYQVAYMVTQTNKYKCAMAGAAVTDMVSAYGGIRWESGMSRMFQYEEEQSRIGATLWEKPELYIENSPVFFADKVQTPLLMMNNDNDGAVPWYQGIEFFTALRRLNKPVWMLVYNGDAHNLEKWPNRIDLSIRMMQFFSHYLKDEPAPDWMINGVKAIDKDKKWGINLLKQ